ncbi:DNA ligase [Paenibacillus filicis]|uniref:DNA ligase n=1 Tax=Paenibacillus gyeongsangnamensis TaxID=3388067 RepID=A0ABT4Q359_9BACL|nr:DNA ligase [Paenibacillus filicis]MCZ8511316.1 DNA ligase [Paenibacillus filicis]
MAAEAREAPFDDPDYYFEPKWDGSRLLLHKQGDRIEAYTRSGRCVTAQLPELKEAAACIKSSAAILDCEGVCLRGGRPVYDDFTYRLRLGSDLKIRHALQTHPAAFVVFDVLLAEREVTAEPLVQRKERLTELLRPSVHITPTLTVPAEGKALFQLTGEQGLEGIVAKRKQSVYIPHSLSKDWLKIKHYRSIDVIILGYRTDPFGLVAGLHFRTVPYKQVGIVEEGFRQGDEEAFLELAKPLHLAKEGRTQWIEPRLCCRMAYKERNDMHQLSDTRFQGFLWDKKPEDCHWIP